MIDIDHKNLSVRQQCNLLRVNRSNVYYKHYPEPDDTEMANEIHEIWL